MGELFPIEAKEIGYGENTEIDLNEKKKILEAIDEHVGKFSSKDLDEMGLKEVHVRKIRDILRHHFAAFGLETSVARMSRLTPISVELKPGHTPCLARGRIMPSQEEQNFLKNKLKELTKMGIVRPAKNPAYRCTGFTVPKKGHKKFRMVIDMRPLNEISLKTALNLPHLEQQLGFVRQAKIFTAFDVLSGFDFLETEEKSRKFFNITTSHGAFSMCGAPMGMVNTPAMFQERIMTEILQPSELYAGLDVGVCQWIDDTLLCATTPENSMDALNRYLEAVKAIGVRLNIRKMELLKPRIGWCGRILSHGSWKFDDKFYKKILEVPRQVFYFATWMSTGIPHLTQHRDKFKEWIKLDGKTLKQFTKKKKAISWNPELYEDWMAFLQTLYQSAAETLANYDPKKD